MTLTAILAKFRATCRRFAGDREGNTLVTFALAFVPLVGLTGAAVDYSRAYSAQTAMQAAADTTALMIAQTAPSTNATDLQTQGSNYFRAMFTRTDVSGLAVNSTYTSTSGATVVVSATATYRTSFMGVIGFQQLPIAASSTATFGNARLRVSLVLDNTGSMASSNKLTALKSALHNGQSTGLLDILHAAAVNNGDVYVSIVPFVKDVNVGTGNSGANWLYWDDAAHQDNTSWDAQNGSCSDNNYNSDRQSCLSASGSCSISGGNGVNTNTMSSCQAASAGSCNNSNYTTQNACQAGGYCSISSHHSQNGCTTNHGTWTTPAIWTVANGVWTSNNTWTPKAHSRWTGCVMDRGDTGAPNSNNYDTNVTAPSSTNIPTQYAAEQYSACPQAVMGLSYDWSGMNTEVSNMVANGSTNQAIGLQLGWLSLVGGGPFTMPAESPNYVYSHVLILLSDGLNTQDRWYGDGVNTATQVDDRQRMTCDHAKAAGIKIYTVQVNTDGAPTSSVLQYCAGTATGVGDPNYFFLLTSSTQIVTTFQQIGTQLSKLRIAR